MCLLLEIAVVPFLQAASPQALYEVAGLGQNPVKSAPALLRYSLPISNKPIREIQRSLEEISEDLRVPGVRFTARGEGLRIAPDRCAEDPAALH